MVGRENVRSSAAGEGGAKKKTVLTARGVWRPLKKITIWSIWWMRPTYLMFRYMYPMPGERFWATTQQ